MKQFAQLALLTAFSYALSAQPVISLQQYVTGFSGPVDIANCGDDRLFIVERAGTIRIIDAQGNRITQPFLDINSKVINGGGEEGLLGLAFHPDYKNNGYFFVYYVNNSSNLVIARYTVTANRNLADDASEEIVLTIAHPNQTNHNGGNLEFGPDGMLYFATGDGGGGGDPSDNGQDPLELLGKMHRINVDSLPYTIPQDNPYFGFASTRNEIWAMGLRNPWRFSFDRFTGDLWIGDVGQNAREEVNFQAAGSAGGENYGWKCYEGNNFYANSGFGCSGSYVFPVFDYANPSLGCSAIGGYVYRGCTYPDLYGVYIFCDYCSGRFWAIQDSNGTWVTDQVYDAGNYNYVAFGEDMNGELFVAGSNGFIYRVQGSSPATLPSITSNGTAICPYDSVMLSTQSGYAAYEWLQDGITVATGLQVYVQDTADYTLIATGGNGCVYTTPATTVTHHALPNPAISGVTEYCAGDSAQLSAGVFSSCSWNDGATTQTNYVQQGNYSVTVANANGCTAAASSVTIAENPLPQPVLQQAGVLCGSASAQLSTTSPFWAYAWSTGDTTATTAVTLPGNYDVTVTDWMGCAGVSPQLSVVAQSALLPVLNAQNGTTLCAGSSAELFLTENYAAYLWSTGETDSAITVQQAGEYWVAVSDTFGCSGNSDTLEIISVPAPAPTLASQNGDTICSNDSTVLSLSESFAGYVWSTGSTDAFITVNSAGSYWALVTDTFGCSGNSDTVSITTLPAPVPHILQGDSIVQCGDGVVELFTDSAYTGYIWSRGDTVPILFTTESGIFNVTAVNANGCVGVSGNVVVEIYPNPPLPTITTDDNQLPPELSVDSGFFYRWFTSCTGDSFTIIQNENSNVLNIAGFECGAGNYGYYIAEISTENNCIALSDTVYVQLEGIRAAWLGAISVQPNPFTHELLLRYTLKDLANLRISMKDVTGKEVALLLDEKKGAGSYSLEINSAEYQLSQGIYFLELANEASRMTLKVVKR